MFRALIELNRLENELRSLGPRSTRKPVLEKQAAGERLKVPPFILAHHDRLRARGRPSTVQVRDWVCRGCFLTVPIGLRTKLANQDDICICDNCGSYIYMPTPEQKQAEEAAEARRREAVLKAAAAPARPARSAIPRKPRPAPAAKKRPRAAARPARRPAKPARPRRSASRRK